MQGSVQKKRSPKRDEDDVVIDDNSSQGSDKKMKGSTETGQPDIVFFNDPDAVTELRRIKE